MITSATALQMTNFNFLLLSPRISLEHSITQLSAAKHNSEQLIYYNLKLMELAEVHIPGHPYSTCYDDHHKTCLKQDSWTAIILRQLFHLHY